MYSKKQLKAIDLIESLIKLFGIERWFTQYELPGITLHTMKALTEKGYIEMKCFNDWCPYYKVIPPQQRRI